MNPYQDGVIVNDLDRGGMTNAQAALIAAAISYINYEGNGIVFDLADKYLDWLGEQDRRH